MTSDRDAFFRSRDEVSTTGPYWKTERVSNTPSPSPTELQRMREKSGSVTDNRPLVTFLYRLMRDELPPGKVEQILLESRIDEPVTTPHEVLFTNGWLAQIAQDITYRLTGWDHPWPTDADLPPNGIPVNGGYITTNQDLSPEDIERLKERFKNEQARGLVNWIIEDDDSTD